MTVLRLPVALLLATALSLAGCARHQQTALYQLDAGDLNMPTASQGLAVLLGPVSIADYLQREVLLQRQLDGSLTAAEGARWAGNLAAEVDQQLLRQLAARLNTQRLVLEPAASGFTPEVRLALAITRLDSGPQRPAVLEAQWRLSSAEGKLLDGRLVRLEEAHAGSIVDQVRAQSLVIQQLVEQLALALEQYGKPAATASKPALKPAPAKPAKQPPAPRIPVVEPSRNEGEVFRF